MEAVIQINCNYVIKILSAFRISVLHANRLLLPTLGGGKLRKKMLLGVFGVNVCPITN